MSSLSFSQQEKPILTQDNLHNFSFSSNEQNSKPKETKEDIFLLKFFDSNNNRIEEQEKCDNKNFEKKFCFN